jgi:PRC-barrel domain
MLEYRYFPRHSGLKGVAVNLARHVRADNGRESLGRVLVGFGFNRSFGNCSLVSLIELERTLGIAGLGSQGTGRCQYEYDRRGQCPSVSHRGSPSLDKRRSAGRVPAFGGRRRAWLSGITEIREIDPFSLPATLGRPNKECPRSLVDCRNQRRTMMKYYLLAGTAVALSLATSSAFAECKIGTQATYTDQDRLVNSAQARQDLRQLRQAAFILRDYDQDEACQEVTEAILAIRQQSDEPTSSAGETTGTVEKNATADSPRRETAVGTSWQEQSRAYVASAKPLSEAKGRISASNLIGADLVGKGDDTIGEIEDVVMAPDGKATYVVVSSGGFLGVGESQSAIPYSELKIAYDGDGSAIFFIPMTEEQLSKAPHFKRGSMDWVSDENWRQKNDQYYGQANRG